MCEKQTENGFGTLKVVVVVGFAGAGTGGVSVFGDSFECVECEYGSSSCNNFSSPNHKLPSTDNLDNDLSNLTPTSSIEAFAPFCIPKEDFSNSTLWGGGGGLSRLEKSKRIGAPHFKPSSSLSKQSQLLPLQTILHPSFSIPISISNTPEE